MSLTGQQREFIEAFGASDPGMPRAMGLILGYLLVCEPVEQSSQDMQKELELSAGSISTMIGMLVDSGLISKTKKPGDRKLYYMVAKGAWHRTVETRLESIKGMRAIAAKGMAASPDNYRMQEVYHVYDLLASDLERIVARLQSQPDVTPTR